MTDVGLAQVTFRWPLSDEPLLEGFDLSLESGSVTVIVGASGSGKSTLLRLLAGLEVPISGHVSPRSLRSGELACVFQTPTLLPWRSVYENVVLPLQLLGTQDGDAAEAAARTAIQRVGLSADADKLPRQLSGGMQMRAALARALVTSPSLLLLDEPFGSLDAITRHRLYQVFSDAWGAATVALVTHDIDEAVLLGDRIVVVGGSPLQVRADLRVELPRPRAAALRHDPRFAALASAVEAEL